MKKKVLFIIPGLEIGGAEKSLINLFGVLDYSRFEVDLFVLTSKGSFFGQVPKEVNIVFPGRNYADFAKPLVSSCLGFLRKLQFKMIYHRLKFASINKKFGKGRAEQYAWKHHRESIGKLEKRYDVAIGYLEKTSIYLCVDLVDADRKAGFIRTHYGSMGLDKDFDRKYFQKLDFICANGAQSLEVLRSEFPEFSDKMKLVPNVVSPDGVRELAKEPVEDFSPENSKLNLISVGRLDKAKGYDLAIEACAILKNKNIPVQWRVIGEGVLREELASRISHHGVAAEFNLLGGRVNPYPYVAASDIFVQTSRFEGKSNTVEEAKMLRKPIVVTDFEGVSEQVQDGETALIVAKDAQAIAEAIIRLGSSAELRNHLSENLHKESVEAPAADVPIYQILT